MLQNFANKVSHANFCGEISLLNTRLDAPISIGPPSLVFFILAEHIAAGITQRICQRTAAPPCGRNMEEGRGSRYYSGPKEHIPEHLQNGSQIAKKVIFFLIHTIHTKF